MREVTDGDSHFAPGPLWHRFPLYGTGFQFVAPVSNRWRRLIESSGYSLS